VAGCGAGVGSSIRAMTGGGSFSLLARTLLSVGLESALASSFFSFSFFLGFTPAPLKAASNCLDDAPRTGRPLLGAVEGWPGCDGPGAGVEVDVLPCAGGLDSWESGLGLGGCFWDSCFCGGWRGSLGGLGRFAFGMIVGAGVAAFAGVFFGAWDAAPLACFWAALFAFLLDSAGGLGFAASFFFPSRFDGGIALLITDWSL
jgi:hypothetical protein